MVEGKALSSATAQARCPAGHVSVVDKTGKSKFVTQTKHGEIRKRDVAYSIEIEKS
jgi:hypothetical protein